MKKQSTRFWMLMTLIAFLFTSPSTTLAQTSLGTPDPTLLPVATTLQFPLTGNYNALNVPSLAAGGYYLDPTTGVKIYKLTSATYPTASPYWGHDYSEGGDEISLPYNGDTRTVFVRQNGSAGYPWWLMDFTPGQGLSNARQLSGTLSPGSDLGFTFSNNPATPYYAYVSNGTTIRRFDFRTMTEVPGNGWPVTEANAAWLHQSENDGLFVWLRGGTNGSTVVGYEPATGTLKTYTNANLNEPRIDRAGRYIGIDMTTPENQLLVWDWQTNTITWSTTGAVPFAHNASLRRRWITVDWNLSFPDEFVMYSSDIVNSTTHIGGPANGTMIYGNGTWIQHPANLNDQWALFSSYGSLPTGANWLAPGGMILITPNGQRRLLGQPYNTTTNYTYYSFAKLSSDGRYVMFTSNMNGTNRSDVFLAELPVNLSGATTTTIASTTTTVRATPVTITPTTTTVRPTTTTVGSTTTTTIPTSTPLAISVVSAQRSADRSKDSFSGASSIIFRWNTNKASNSQVEYGLTTAYGNLTTVNAGMVTSHYQTQNGMAASKLYHYRVKSRDAAGNLAMSKDYTIATPASAPVVENVSWTSLVNTTATGNSLKKTSGCDGCSDAGAISQQQITSGNGYAEFTASETTAFRALGLNNGNPGTTADEIKFSIKLQAGHAEVRESGVYKIDTLFVTGDVFRIAVESGVVKYYKNGSLFYTSTVAPSYPLLVDTALLNLNGTITSAKISH